jgi:hypothetical protein
MHVPTSASGFVHSPTAAELDAAGALDEVLVAMTEDGELDWTTREEEAMLEGEARLEEKEEEEDELEHPVFLYAI